MGSTAPERWQIRVNLVRSGRRPFSKVDDGTITVSFSGIDIDSSNLVKPLQLASATIAVASIDLAGSSKKIEGRFPILRRIGSKAVIPQSEGIEGWVWTSHHGTAMAVMCDGEAPNLAVILKQPLSEQTVIEYFEPKLFTALAEISPLGVPSIYGMLFKTESPLQASDAFKRISLLGPITDREVPRMLRRSLHGDKPANPHTRPHYESDRSTPPPGR